MSRDIGITLTPEELANWPVSVIVRVAEKCPECEGVGKYLYSLSGETCPSCHGTGYASPYAVGDVLACYESPPLGDDIPYCRAAIEDVRLVRLQEVTPDDALASGTFAPLIPGADTDEFGQRNEHGEWNALRVFMRDWDRNNPDHPWSSNPTVRVVPLRPVEEPK